MEDIKYASPSTVDDACRLLDEHDQAAVLSGGQSLLPLLRTGAASVDHVVDITGIDGQEFIRKDGNELRFGCLTRYVDIVRSDLVAEHCPVLAEICEQVGDRQVRNRGTLCGSIANADPSGDPPVLATIMNPDIVATGVGGTTVYEGESFFSGFYETALAPDEIVTEVRFPVLDGAGAAYRKWESSEGAYPVATVGALLKLEAGTVSEARIATGALEGEPTRIEAVEEYLTGREPRKGVVEEAAERLGESSNPLDDHEGSAQFKRELAKTLAYRTIDEAAERVGGVS